jgi:hypothetical protein
MLWTDKFNDSRERRHEPGHENVNDFLFSELNLTKEQQEQFRKERIRHSKKMELLKGEEFRLKQKLIDQVFEDNPDEELVENLSIRIGELKIAFEKEVYHHFTELKTLCDTDQVKKFKVIFKEIFKKMRRHEGPPMRNNKKQPPSQMDIEKQQRQNKQPNGGKP